MILELFTAIEAAYSTDPAPEFAAFTPGGLHYGKIPTGTPLACVCMEPPLSISQDVTGWRVRQHSIVFVILTNAKKGAGHAMSVQKAAKKFFENQTLTASGQRVTLFPLSEAYPTPEMDYYAVRLKYKVIMAKET